MFMYENKYIYIIQSNLKTYHEINCINLYPVISKNNLNFVQ